MDCHKARAWLLEAERPSRLEEAPAELAAHVDGCPACRRLAGNLESLERRYRDDLLPATAARARDSFLRALAVPRPRRRWRRALPRWALAATVLLAVGAAVWSLLPTPQARGSDVVERLLDWNLDLSQSRTPDERKRIYAEHAGVLKAALREADLPPGDRELADTLVASGSWLSANDDPTAEADRFDDLADRLLGLIDAATSKQDAKNLRRLADFYRRVAERGVQANVERAEDAGSLSLKRQKKLERVRLREARRAEKLAVLLERAPAAARKEIRRALDLRKPGRE